MTKNIDNYIDYNNIENNINMIKLVTSENSKHEKLLNKNRQMLKVNLVIRIIWEFWIVWFLLKKMRNLNYKVKVSTVKTGDQNSL